MTINQQIRITISRQHHKRLLVRVAKMLESDHTAALAFILDLFLQDHPAYPIEKKDQTDV